MKKIRGGGDGRWKIFEEAPKQAVRALAHKNDAEMGKVEVLRGI